VENGKLKTKKTDMLRSIGRQSWESVESVLDRRKAAVGRSAQKEGFKPGMNE